MKSLPKGGYAGSRFFGKNGEARLSIKGVLSAATEHGSEDSVFPPCEGECEGELEMTVILGIREIRVRL